MRETPAEHYTQAPSAPLAATYHQRNMLSSLSETTTGEIGMPDAPEKTLPLRADFEPRAPLQQPKTRWVVDLFCGAGGLAEGFRMAGFETALGIDMRTEACSTFRANHPTATVVETDISALHEEDFLHLLRAEPGTIGVLCGGPPCQGFSVAGKRLADDPRNFLYRHFLHAVEVLRPAWVVMENVPGLLKHAGVGDAIYRDFAELDVPASQRYRLQHMVVNAADYGVPQTRRRVLFVAHRQDIPLTQTFSLEEAMTPVFSETLDLFGSPPRVTVNEAIGDLPPIKSGEGAEEFPYDQPATHPYQKLMRGELTLTSYYEEIGVAVPLDDLGTIAVPQCVYNHLAQEHSPRLVERFDNRPPGGS
jgi:site-specific DNA-cytosine methylase